MFPILFEKFALPSIVGSSLERPLPKSVAIILYVTSVYPGPLVGIVTVVGPPRVPNVGAWLSFLLTLKETDFVDEFTPSVNVTVLLNAELVNP